MINTAILMGRLTATPELKTIPSGTSVLVFTLAIDRSYFKQGEERQTDFISCVAFKQTAEFIAKYFGKGAMIAVTGELRSRVYEDKNGTKHYITEVNVRDASFTGEAKQEGKTAEQDMSGYQMPEQGFYGGGQPF